MELRVHLRGSPTLPPERRPMSRSFVLAVFAVSQVSCATLKTADGGSTIVDTNLVSTVSFDHQCSPEKIVILRSANWTYDLGVCGKTRRYKRFAAGRSINSAEWVDVTSLYPASALPTTQ
jgi:hypothetical protein